MYIYIIYILYKILIEEETLGTALDWYGREWQGYFSLRVLRGGALRQKPTILPKLCSIRITDHFSFSPDLCLWSFSMGGREQSPI